MDSPDSYLQFNFNSKIVLHLLLTEAEISSAGKQPASNNLTDWNCQEGIKTPSYPSTISGVYVFENPKTNQ
jgi:hypothetical protein